MKITLAENISEITLEQFQKYNLLLEEKDIEDIDFENKKIAIFSKLDYKSCRLLTQKDRADILKLIDESMTKTVEFVNTFEMKDIKYGFVPNLDNISGFEFADLQSAGMDINNLHIVMAILFRPIVKEDKYNNYKIEAYSGTEKYEDLMKQMPLHLVNGALFFFLNLSKELQKDTLKSMEQVLRKAKMHHTTLRNGDGMLHSLN